MATEANHRRGQDVCQLQEVQGHQGGQDNGELDRHVQTNKCKSQTHDQDERSKQRGTSF